MRIATVATVLLLAGGVGLADDVKIQKPGYKDMWGDRARPYTGKKVEITGRISAYSVDKKTNKWYFRCTLLDDKDKDSTVNVYLFFDDMDAAAALKEKLDEGTKKKATLKDRPVAVVRGICELYGDLAPGSKIPPVILNGTEIVEYKEAEKEKGKDKEKDKK